MYNEKPLFFYIMPRTGSTSLTDFWKNCLGHEAVFSAKVIEEFFNGIPVCANSQAPSLNRLRNSMQNSNAKIFTVMAPYGVHKYSMHEMRIFTVLRHPVERCISLLKFMHTHPSLNDVNKRVVSHRGDITKILNDSQLLCFNNEQVRMLSGSDKIILDISDLNKAKENLMSFENIGRFGDFSFANKTLTQYFPNLKIDRTPAFPKLNTADDTTITITEEMKTQFLKSNYLDMQLFSSIFSE